MLGPLRAGAPRRIGPYEVMARLGAGGMGEVFLARATGADGTFVAVKTVRRDFAGDAAFRQRFRREIKVAAMVRSAYAVAPVGGDADAEVPWLATAYVPGPSLSQAVRRTGPLPVATVRELGAGIARALADLHGAGVLHRDLKPGNVMLSVDGPRLIDFGIARNGGATTMTATGMMVGTPSFMSPEHVAGARSVTGASDVFCLGSLLCYAATGEDPFGDGPVAAVLYRVSQAEADLERVPEELRGVIGACLRLAPADRPSAAELVGLLGAEVPRVFPWPGGVLSLLAEYGDTARRIGEAAASGTGVADLPTLGPAVPYSPTAAGYRPAGAGPKGRRTRWGRITAGVAAVAVLAAVGVVFADRQDGQAGSAGDTPGGGGGATGTSPSAGAGPVALDRVIQPYGGEGRTGDFGAGGSDRESRPAGWSPWATAVDAGVGPCAVGPELLVCSGDGGAAVALRSADGKKAWSKPSRGSAPLTGGQYPAVVGEVAWMTGPDGLVGYRLSDGEEVGRLAAPGGAYAVKGTDLRGDVLYTTYMDGTDFEKPAGLVTAVSLAGGVPEERWRTAVDVFPETPVAAGGQVYVPGNGTVLALDARGGGRTARADGLDSCSDDIVVRAGRVLCPRVGEPGVEVLDARTLRRERILGRSMLVTARPAVSSAGVVALSDGTRLAMYDLETGAERWSGEAGGQWVAFVGDRLLSGTRTAVSAVTVNDPAASPGGADRRVYNGPEGAAVEGESIATGAVAAGGALFIGLADGVVVSGYAP
ncbi:protein kinase [Streptomyces sp. NPDC008121]|uniref:serine/threonine-protein kinase n=1 Tax=Streptomyces sp. NPDC008121 TaxID=3364809 RepID=UPI0036E67D95